MIYIVNNKTSDKLNIMNQEINNSNNEIKKLIKSEYRKK